MDLTMQFTLTDVLTILTLLGGIVAVYTTLRKNIIESKILIDQHQKQIQDQKFEIDRLVTKLENEQEQRDIDNKELWTKLVGIESAQSQTNIFLEENLKSINKLLTIHDTEIIHVKNKLTEQDQNIIEFYKTYDLKKKEK